MTTTTRKTASGWDEKALHDAVSVCALFNFMNRYVEGLGIKAGADYFKEAAVERLFRDARVTTIYEGTSEVQRLLIARQVLAQYPL